MHCIRDSRNSGYKGFGKMAIWRDGNYGMQDVVHGQSC